MRIVTVTAEVPIWIMNAVRAAAGHRSVQEALGLGLSLVMNTSRTARLQLVEALLLPSDTDREIVEVAFAFRAEWPENDLPLEDVVEMAAIIVAVAELTPAAIPRFLELVPREGGLQ